MVRGLEDHHHGRLPRVGGSTLRGGVSKGGWRVGRFLCCEWRVIRQLWKLLDMRSFKVPYLAKMPHTQCNKRLGFCGWPNLPGVAPSLFQMTAGETEQAVRPSNTPFLAGLLWVVSYNPVRVWNPSNYPNASRHALPAKLWGP